MPRRTHRKDVPPTLGTILLLFVLIRAFVILDGGGGGGKGHDTMVIGTGRRWSGGVGRCRGR